MFNINWKLKAAGIAVILVIGVGYSIFDKKQSAAYAAAPAIGDVYTVKIKAFMPEDDTDAYPYGVMKVDAVDGSKVVLNIASSRYGNSKSVRKSLSADGKKASFYSGETIEVSQTAIAGLVESGGITHIDR